MVRVHRVQRDVPPLGLYRLVGPALFLFSRLRILRVDALMSARSRSASKLRSEGPPAVTAEHIGAHDIAEA